jgi:hypothetical protein
LKLENLQEKKLIDNFKIDHLISGDNNFVCIKRADLKLLKIIGRVDVKVLLWIAYSNQKEVNIFQSH